MSKLKITTKKQLQNYKQHKTYFSTNQALITTNKNTIL